MGSQNDKCNLCALKVVFDQDKISSNAAKTENFIATLRELQEKTIIDKGYNRRVFVSNTGEGDKSEMCALNLKYFLPKNKSKKCPNFILNMGLKVPEALSLNTARSTDRLTSDIHKMTLVILGLTVVAVVIAFTS